MANSAAQPVPSDVADARRAASSLVWLVADRIFRLGLGFVVGAFVARHLGPHDFGRLSYAVSWAALAGFLVPLGLDGIAKREAVKEPERTGELISTLIGLRIAALIFALGGVALSAAWASPTDRPLIWAACGSLVLPLTAPFDTVMETRWLGRRVFCSRFVATVGSAAWRIALLLNDAGAGAFAWALSLESVLLVVSSGIAFRGAGARIHPRLFNLARGARLLRESWPLILAGLAVTLYGRVDQLIVRHYLGESALGAYAAAVRLSEIGHFLPVLAASTIWPALMAADRSGRDAASQAVRRYLDTSALAGYGWALFVAVGSPLWVRLVYGQEFAESAWILAFYTWSAVFVFVGVAGAQVLVLGRQSTVQLVATGFGAVVSISLNFALLPRVGVAGAVVATILAQAFSGWLSLALFTHSRALCKQIGWALLIPFRWADIVRHIRETCRRRPN